MDMRVLVGANVRRLRLKAGLSQERFAKKTGFSQQYLSNQENGKHNPSIVIVYELAQTLGVSHLDLLCPIKRRKARPASWPGFREPGRKGPSRPFGL